MRAGSLRQRIETIASTPPAAPADLVFGLGARARADVVRVLWPAGILQAETSVATPARGGAARQVATITELNRKPSSCPFLYTWNGSRFEFVTDFMGGGEMGYWVAPGAWNVPDPDEYVRIRGDQLRPRDGRYELRVTSELEEAVFLDRLHLIAVAHPSGVDVYPNEGLKSPAEQRPFAITTVRGPRPPRRAVDHHGHDVLDRVKALDRVFVDDFRLEPIQGYAEEHSLTIDLGLTPDDSRVHLLLTGWTDYAFSSDNVAAHQAGLSFRPPWLEIKDASGNWITAMPEIGLPVGRPQTVVRRSVAIRRAWRTRSAHQDDAPRVLGSDPGGQLTAGAVLAGDHRRRGGDASLARVFGGEQPRRRGAVRLRLRARVALLAVEAHAGPLHARRRRAAAAVRRSTTAS